MAHPETAPLSRLLRSTLLALLPLAGLAAEPGWLDNLHLSATATASYVENLSKTSYGPTRQDAATYELTLDSTRARQLSPALLLVASVQASALNVPDFTLDNATRLGGRLALQHKFGLGAQATVLELSGAARYRSARARGASGWVTEAGLQLSKRVLPNLRLAARANWLEDDAKAAWFDLNQRSYEFEAQWDVTDRWSLTASAGRLSGDIAANAAWSVWGTMLSGGFGPKVFNYYTSRPWAVTNLYGAGWVTYDIEGDVDLWSAAISYAASDRTTVELRRSSAYVVNRVGVTYPCDSWSLGLTHRF